MPRIERVLLSAEHIERRGVDLFCAACRHDLEGIVGKWKPGRYSTDGTSTSWVKIKEPQLPADGGKGAPVRDADLPPKGDVPVAVEI
jgi:ATP-dependent DNA ligase